MTEFTRKRYENNLKCLELIRKFIDRFPDWRFMQLLFNVGLCEDRFYEEPENTLTLLEATFESFESNNNKEE